MWIRKIKTIANIFYWIGSVTLSLLVIAWAGFFVWNHFDEARITREVQKTLAERTATEIEVGETPEETFSFFLGALRDNDFDLAVKYFAPELRDGWRAHLQNIHDKKFLDGMIADLENIEEDAPLSEEHFRENDGKWHLVSL